MFGWGSQERRKEQANKHTSYISKSWFGMYLKTCTPLPVNSNPYVGINADPSETHPERNAQVNRMSVLIHSSIRFKKTLEAEVLKPEIFHVNPTKTDTEQFYQWANWMPSHRLYRTTQLLAKLSLWICLSTKTCFALITL